jgi:methyltransferase (TIGR00027 family)
MTQVGSVTPVGSARFDGDTWDLASSVGLTATMVAAARAVASRAPDPLIDDQFAAPLVRAVGVDYFARMAGGELDPSELDEDAARGMRRFADAMAIRTRFFDEFFLDATRAGIRQAVILASGLDSRAYRLEWPPGTAVFEVDQPQVIDFKTTTLAALGAQPTADRRAVAIDLREHWPAALKQAGFDPARRTAWIAEGLLGYLPAEAQDRLLDPITAQSAPGSRLATEGLLDIKEAQSRGAAATHAAPVRAVDPTRLRARYGGPGVFRRPHRCRDLPERPWLADRRRERHRLAGRTRVAADRRRRRPVRRGYLRFGRTEIGAR